MEKIYICTHTDFNCPVTNPVYQILDGRQIDDNHTREGLHGSYYSELTNYRYASESMQLPDIVGFCGYRKYFAFMDDVPDLKQVISQRGCIVGQRLDFGPLTVRQHYAFNHIIDDLEALEYTVKDVSPEFLSSFTNFLEGHLMYPCNMFIMKRDDFKRMMKFVFSIMDEFTRRLLSVWATPQDRVIDAFRKGHTRCLGGVRHQSRIGGYLAERLVSAYLMKCFPDALPVGMTITQDAIRN